MYTKVRPQNRIRSEESYDPRLLEHMTYKNQISDPVSSQLPLYRNPPLNQDVDTLYDIERNFVFVSSVNRDRTKYPDPAYFKIDFPESYRDVVSVELSGGTLPNKANILTDGYVLLDIPDFNHISTGNGEKIFGILNFYHHPNPDFVNIDKQSTNDMPVVFKALKARLDSITILLRHPDGTQLFLGDENPANPANFTLQTSFIFEIHTRVKKRQGLSRDIRAPVII